MDEAIKVIMNLNSKAAKEKYLKETFDRPFIEKLHAKVPLLLENTNGNTDYSGSIGGGNTTFFNNGKIKRHSRSNGGMAIGGGSIIADNDINLKEWFRILSIFIKN